MARHVVDGDNFDFVEGVTKEEFDALQEQVDNINPDIEVTTQTVQLENGAVRLYCSKMGRLVVLWVEMTNKALALGRTVIGSGIIPEAYRPTRRYTSETCRPINTQDTAITNVTEVTMEIKSDGSLVVFTSEGLGTGWIVQGSFVYIVGESA